MTRSNRGGLTLLLLLSGCGGSLGYYGDVDKDGDTSDLLGDTANPGDTAVVADTDVDSDSDSDTDVDSDSDTDADADSDTDADTDSDTDTDTGLPPTGVQDGTYVGTISIDYEMLVPLIGGNSTCDGTVTLTVDQSINPMVSGSISNCDWPVLDLWALLTLGSVDGSLAGDIFGAAASGQTNGSDGNGIFVWNESWSGSASGTTLDGSFSGGSFLVDDFSGSWTATRIGP